MKKLSIGFGIGFGGGLMIGLWLGFRLGFGIGFGLGLGLGLWLGFGIGLRVGLRIGFGIGFRWRTARERFPMTVGELFEIVASLPNVPAPPGFEWTGPWQSGPQYLAWRRLISQEYRVTNMVCLDMAVLEMPAERRNRIAEIRQEVACASCVDVAMFNHLKVSE